MWGVCCRQQQGMTGPKHDAYLCSCCRKKLDGCWKWGSCWDSVLLRSFRTSVAFCTSLQYGRRPSSCSIGSCCTHYKTVHNFLARGHERARQRPEYLLLLVFRHQLGAAQKAYRLSGSLSSMPPSRISPGPSAAGFGPAVQPGLSVGSSYQFGFS